MQKIAVKMMLRLSHPVHPRKGLEKGFLTSVLYIDFLDFVARRFSRLRREERGLYIKIISVCKMGLTGLHDSYDSWHLYICRSFLFALSAFLSLTYKKTTWGKSTLYIVTYSEQEQFRCTSAQT